MAILIDETKRVLVQGVTGREGRARTKLMRVYGTNIVAGVTPGKGGQTVLGVPVFNTAQEAVKALGKHRYFGIFCARGGRERSGDFCDCATFISQGPFFVHRNCFQNEREEVEVWTR